MISGAITLTSPTKEITENGKGINVTNEKSEYRIIDSCCTKFQEQMCSRNCLAQRIPIISWLPSYSINSLLHDFMAGLTVGLTAIPQGIAYATVAGLEPQYGLYSAFMGCFVYIIFGSCKDITIGPTAIMALMSHSHVESSGPDFAVLLCFLSGCIILLLGILQLGFLVDFISMPVTVGFTSAAAITIASSQVKGLLGISYSSDGFLDSWIKLFENIEDTDKWDAILGFSACILLLFARKLKDLVKFDRNTQYTLLQKVGRHSARLLSLGRNAIAVIIGIIMAYAFHLYGYSPFKITGNIKEGFPPFDLPPFDSSFGNKTFDFVGMCEELGSSLATTPLIAILESVAIAKAFSKGKAVDATQELIALGASNVCGSFVRSFPVTGSFTRTAVNNASGVRTPLGGAFTGILVLLALGLLTSTFYYIPKAVLSAVIVCAVLFMVEYEAVGVLWRSKKLDLIPLIATFICCLFIGLEYGIIIGVGINLLFILYDTARPGVEVSRATIGSRSILVVTPNRSLIFPSSDYVNEVIFKTSFEGGSDIVVVIDGKHIQHIDTTVAKSLRTLLKDFSDRKQTIILWNWNKRVAEVCYGFDSKVFVCFRDGETLEHLFKETSTAVSEESIPMSENSESILVDAEVDTAKTSDRVHVVSGNVGNIGETLLAESEMLVTSGTRN